MHGENYYLFLVTWLANERLFYNGEWFTDSSVLIGHYPNFKAAPQVISFPKNTKKKLEAREVRDFPLGKLMTDNMLGLIELIEPVV